VKTFTVLPAISVLAEYHGSFIITPFDNQIDTTLWIQLHKLGNVSVFYNVCITVIITATRKPVVAFFFLSNELPVKSTKLKEDHTVVFQCD